MKKKRTDIAIFVYSFDFIFVYAAPISSKNQRRPIRRINGRKSC